MRSSLSASLVIVLMLIAVGCAGPAEPRFRTGSLPYPGLFTLYEPLDVEQIDEHSYGLPPLFKQGSKGIVYTERGGFIDMGHIRWIADWAWYYNQRCRDALRRGQRSLAMPMDKPSRMHVRITYPPGWNDLPVDEREALIEEIALRFGQEAAWTLGLWHEIATFYGFARLIIVPEYESAFAYCDVFSHLLALHAFEYAIRGEYESFDVGVTQGITMALGDMQPRSVEGTYEAIESVEGRWWEDGRTLRRYLDLGLAGGPIRPWLIPDTPGGPGRYGESWPVPGLHDLRGSNIPTFEISINPLLFQTVTIRHAAGIRSGRIHPQAHFPAIIEDIRRRHLAENGPGTDQP